ncbi:hypothetical protein FB45DRAFT_1022778 [Roridomyces roridus]|uniref:Response regulatory domain-containing protein n=1 Tax=Roridomyces roridus TaxID=1738132 RepID=A0AAD7FW30_9AGAR|nr:hypothetical protein FB45DRAFT_1022778 [Roridomyces roridus]
MGGVEAAQRIREYELMHDLKPTPIIALNVRSEAGDRERFIEAGMNDLITKPLRRVDLLTAIHAQTQKPELELQARL